MRDSQSFSISSMRIRLEHLVLLFLIVGSLLRLIWPSDMEWKADEIWMFENSRATAAGEAPWPMLGMRSSIGIMNPGMSIWLFILIAHLAKTPVAMVIVVQILNVLALWGLYCFIRLKIPKEKRGPWLWGLILVSVSPLPILFSRKIWAQDLLPPFALLVLIGHWCRKSPWGSFLWGLAGTLVGQIHMSGFFLAFAFFGWTLARDRKSARWVPWLLGSAIGAIGLLPWLREFPGYGSAGWNFTELITLKFFTQWIAIALGVDLQFSMHTAFWSNFLREPVVYGVPTYLIAVAHVFLVLVGLKIVFDWFLPKSRLAYRSKLENFPEARFYLQATLFGVGILMTLSGIRVHAFYLVVLFPFLHLWLAMKLYGQKRTLLAITLAQVFISVVFLVYVHRNGGVPEGDYGTAFRRQVYPTVSR
jgi:hypothetical protein